jgi:hypothetical protein
MVKPKEFVGDDGLTVRPSAQRAFTELFPTLWIEIMIDHVVNVAHRSINHLGMLWGAYRSFVNLKWAETPSQAFIVLVGQYFPSL